MNEQKLRQRKIVSFDAIFVHHRIFFFERTGSTTSIGNTVVLITCGFFLVYLNVNIISIFSNEIDRIQEILYYMNRNDIFINFEVGLFIMNHAAISISIKFVYYEPRSY